MQSKTPRSATRASHDSRRLAREELGAVTARLIADYAGALPAGTVIRHLAVAREQLLAAGVRAGLSAAAEAMARKRLSELVPGHALA